jgi:hypothetical protein
MPAIITACHNNGRLEPYVELVRAIGSQVVPFHSFTLVGTMLPVPFAVTTARRVTLCDIDIALVMAISYRTMLSVLGAEEASGLISPMLAPHAADLLFGTVAACMPLTVRM